MLTQYILKVAGRCNLNCTYCYMYNLKDSGWKNRPSLMSEAVFDMALLEIERHAKLAGSKAVSILFHGGEPCLMGVDRFEEFCSTARSRLSPLFSVSFSIQTNGTLLNKEWVEAFRRNDVIVGVSLDGPSQTNDIVRVDHRGRGSYSKIIEGLSILEEGGVPFGVLCVIPLGSSGLEVHRHFLQTGIRDVTYLLPHFTHDNISLVHRRFGATPCADFLIPIFDDWSTDPMGRIVVQDLKNVVRIIMGGQSQIDTYGGIPGPYITIETDGIVEGLDSLRACASDLSRDIMLIEHYTQQLRTLPDKCQACAEKATCSGGYFPHRFSSDTGFNNPSVWCADILKIFSHIRGELGISIADTAQFSAKLQKHQWSG